MPESERRQRMMRLRDVVSKGDIYQWGSRIFQEVLHLHKGGEQ
jgi:trehalose-6-phosphate synthase